MARRKSKRTFRRFSRKISRGYKKAKSSGLPQMVAAGGYGAMRAYIATFISPVTNKIPLGGISDEVGLILAMHLVKKTVRNPTINRIATVGQYIEAASIGQSIATGQVNIQNLGATNTTNGSFMATLG